MRLWQEKQVSAKLRSAVAQYNARRKNEYEYYAAESEEKTTAWDFPLVRGVHSHVQDDGSRIDLAPKQTGTDKTDCHQNLQVQR